MWLVVLIWLAVAFATAEAALDLAWDEVALCGVVLATWTAFCWYAKRHPTR